MSRQALRTRVPQLRTSSPDALRQDLGRAQGDLDQLLFALQEGFQPRWQFGRRITAATARSSCFLRLNEAPLVDTRGGAVRLYLPRATTDDAGLAVGFLKQIPTGAVHLQPPGGALINGLASLENLTQVGFHYVVWDGTAWWVREASARVSRHSTAYQPLGLWQFSAAATGGGTGMSDSSGHGYDLSLEAGTQRYAHITQTMQGLYLDGSSNLFLNSAEAAFQITGDLTVEMLFLHLAPAVNDTYWFAHGNAGELEADNVLYSLGYFSAAPTVGWLQESGAGTDRTGTPANVGPTPGVLCHWAVKRSGNVVTLYNNGHQWGAATTIAAAPTGGTSGRFRIGALTAGNRITGVMASFKLITRALTADEIRGEYNYTLGPSYGFIDDFSDVI